MWKILDNVRLLREIFKLQKIIFEFDAAIDDAYEVFNFLTKRHPRFKIIKNKQIGVAYINLRSYLSETAYIESVNGKNSAAYYARKAARRGHNFCKIDRNKYAEDIALIESSREIRQGKKMPEGYGKIISYDDKSNYEYYGVLYEDKLVGYVNIGIYGNFALIDRLLGHSDYLNDGIMYLMLTRVAKNFITSHVGVDYLIYDTWYGGLPGLRNFKAKLGFKPCIAEWIYQDLSK